MKNIHILPTDKPSRLHYYNHIDSLGLSKEYLKWKQGRNIYITSDEEIKEGEEYWFLTKDSMVLKSKNTNEKGYSPKGKKIILTTDQDLIKDGIQTINDEFLEWFVKNPSCEYIEIENVYDKFLNGDKRSVSDFRKKYKINIPKEEPKQCDICKRAPRLEGTNKCESCYSVVRHVLEQDPELKDKLLPDLRKKQETLEEVAEKEFPLLDTQFCRTGATEEENFQLLGHRKSFIKGAKWQQERMYSENDLKEAFKQSRRTNIFEIGMPLVFDSFEDWFKQYKK